MSSLKETKERLGLTKSIKRITSSYQSLANMKVNRIRDNVLKTRKFLDGVSKIYHHAKVAYLGSLGKESLKGASFIRRNKKSIVVFMSANERFYGTLILDTWKKIQGYLENNEAELVVIGNIGKNLVENRNLDINVHYFNLNDNEPEQEQIKFILQFIKKYEKIIVFHGRFKSALRQIPARSNVSGGVTLEEAPQETKNYIFEPTPKAILKFFEEEIIGALFNQTILEHRLARLASRMVAMDRATQNADEEIEKLQKKTIQFKRRIQNKKQLNKVIRSNLVNK